MVMSQGLPGDGHDRAVAYKLLQNNPWGMVNSARKNIFKIFLKKIKKRWPASTILSTSNCKILRPYAFKFHQI
jgi:hypothetical protein